MRRTPFCEISVEVMWKHVEDSDFANSNSTDPPRSLVLLQRFMAVILPGLEKL